MSLTSEVLGLFGPKRKPFIERLADRFLEAVEGAADSAQRSTGRAAEAAGEARRRTQAHLREAGERARAGARAQRDMLSERVEAIGRRAAEMREERERRREERRMRRVHRRVRPRRLTPMQLDVRRDDRIVLRGRRPVNLRTADGSVIRYRFYDRPSFWRRFYLNVTGRRVWPR
jgi:hypothetical protein